ncbi:MAG TPA: hypothetical protein VMV94_04865 [Phycisphaerae bacterium]|nr:hypothetical protein [Phycisphaerae bacterium]
MRSPASISKRLDNRRLSGAGGRIWLIALAAAAMPDSAAIAQPMVIIADAPHQAVIRRTDHGGLGFIDPRVQHLPAIVEMHIGTFAPTSPRSDRFTGTWQSEGGFLRFDIVLAGLINPPGPLGWADTNPVYNPMRYGPNPLYGFIEFDADVDENTGGELDAPQYRYQGNVGRFGGLPSDPRFAGRVALDGSAFDGDITTPPFVDRSGEEFHLAFLGELIEEVDVVREKSGGTRSIFEEGEIWRVKGSLFHRAHGYDAFTFGCAENPGMYEPEVVLQFEHSVLSNTTTVSLVYPLHNSDSAALEEDNNLDIQPNDGCASNQNSVEEALADLTFSATYTDPITRQLPEFQSIAGWEFKDASDYLDPAAWRVFGLVGTAYASLPPDGARFIWTDVYPRPVTGDFDGNGVADGQDAALSNAFVASNDGDPAHDLDGVVNGVVEWRDFAADFCVYDTDYDGFVGAGSSIIPGDMNLDGVVDYRDVADFVQALLDPNSYVQSHQGADPLLRGDLNHDGVLDGKDIADFIQLLLSM